MHNKQRFDIPIIYEDEAVIAFNKPPGVILHASPTSDDEYTIADWLLENRPEMGTVGEPHVVQSGTEVIRPGIVHRLDRDTSGVVVVAKTDVMYRLLKKQFQERTVTKVYNAFLYGRVTERSGSIDLPIGRSMKNHRKRVVEGPMRGKVREAHTQYKVLQLGTNFSFVEAFPKTGRTHQLRVHFKGIGHPIVCDPLYASERSCLLWFQRLALHARYLSFLHYDGSLMTLEAPFPVDFEMALNAMERQGNVP